MNDARITYLDHASGEPLHPAARDVLERALDPGYADPRRLHRPARESRINLYVDSEALVSELDRLADALPSLVERLRARTGVSR